MFLVRTKTRSLDTARIIADHDEAIAFAKAHIGEHLEVDGCSTRPDIRTFPTHTYMTRQTSFGRRQAWVLSPTTEGGLIFNLDGV